MSPAEAKFIKIMGGRLLTLRHVASADNGFPLTFVASMGRILKRERVRREVRVGKYFVDFGVDTPYYKKAIEIDGKDYHTDIVFEQQRDDYLADWGWEVLHVPAWRLYKNPRQVRRRVRKFLHMKRQDVPSFLSKLRPSVSFRRLW
jgi:very-short-patch-repair endonuclease